MTTQQQYEVGKKNQQLPKDISERLDKMKCGVCGKKVDYEIYVRETQFDILYRQSGYKGQQIPVCNKCFKIQVYFNDIIFNLCKIIRRFI